ncbi:MAG: IPT/TIG domain-containing protein, partial [Myxococcales bacterium]|nr:IPT/TIG domain-containing protein [Myxococcales bacterium]
MKRATLLTLLAAALCAQACLNTGDDRGPTTQVHFGQGARGGSGGSGAGGSGAGGSGGSGFDPPAASGMSPTSGEYGSVVTITGSNLGSSARSDVQLVLGGGGEVVLTPTDSDFVHSWTEDQVSFRFAFPAEGAVAIETPQGAALAGDFQPTWSPGTPYPIAPGASVVSSVATGSGELAVVIDTTPPTLSRFSASAHSDANIAVSGYRKETLRLYLGETLEVVGFALSDTSPPEILQLDPDGNGGLVANATGVTVSESFVLAGGASGAVVWFSENDQWSRARPSAGAWSIDKGPIADPDPSAPDHAAGATSDGTLWIAHSVDSGTLLDDMERPMCQKLGPSDTSFGGSFACGISMDDYITSLDFSDRGRGTVLRYCGSDVDPW